MTYLLISSCLQLAASMVLRSKMPALAATTGQAKPTGRPHITCYSKAIRRSMRRITNAIATTGCRCALFAWLQLHNITKIASRAGLHSAGQHELFLFHSLLSLLPVKGVKPVFLPANSFNLNTETPLFSYIIHLKLENNKSLKNICHCQPFLQGIE